jgi:hypothetical protein
MEMVLGGVVPVKAARKNTGFRNGPVDVKSRL